MAIRPIIATPRMPPRKLRRPVHTFNLKSRPFQIQPFLIAPVLPGETFKNLLLQSRVVSDPIRNPLIGWHCEYYFFYVKHRDLDARDLLQTMMLDPDVDMSSLDGATSVPHYHTNGTDLAINWSALCLDRVVEEYFRSDTDGTPTLIDGLPPAGLNRDSFLDSAIDNADYVTAADVNLSDAGSAFGTEVRASEIEASMRLYEQLKQANLIEMTYEDYLRQHGVRVKAEEHHRPELIRYIKEWTYPSNTIDPTSGTPRSAVSWSIAERADKDRFIKEPGFIYGVNVIRPKVYLRNLTSSAVMLMNNAQRWLPSILRDDTYSSMAKVTAGDPPLDSNTDAYWIDLKDLLLYGDQFLNYVPVDTDGVGVALPLAALGSSGKKYPTSAMVDELFVTDTAGVSGVRQDGVVTLSIMSQIGGDTTPNFVGTQS